MRQIRSSNVGAEIAGQDEDELLTDIRKSMGHIDRLPLNVTRMVDRYLQDMSRVISEIARVLVPGGKAFIIVGDSNLRGIYIRNSVGIRLLAEAHGLELAGTTRRHIPSHRRYLPPPRLQPGNELAKRMRTEVLLSFRKAD